MKVLVIGDVHGCYYTLKNLINRAWNPRTMHLIQLGDLINKGPHSAQCIQYWRWLEYYFAERLTLLKGNHEQMYLEAVSKPKTDKWARPLQEHFAKAGIDTREIRAWLQGKPLKWSNEHLLVTHAGWRKNTPHPFDEQNKKGVLYHKDELAFLKQIQVIGHSIVEGNKPLFSTRENAWRIDTGAWQGGVLTGLLLSEEGEMEAVYSEPLHLKDKALVES